MSNDDRQARIAAIRSDLARPWQEVERAVETARWLLAELEAATARAERAEAERDRTQQWLDRFQSEAATQQVRAIRAEQRLKKIAAAGYDLEGQAMTFVLSFHVRERHPGEYDDALCGNGTCNSVRKHVAAWKAALRAALAEGRDGR